MKRVLMISPHFPPDTSAGAHRVRLLAPHLERYGWRPTVLTVRPESYEGRLDPGLAALVPGDLEVVRCGALPYRWSRLVGFGDLGLRAWLPLRRAARRLLASGDFQALFITIYPSYPALLGRGLKRRFRLPFVLDYQDPWVGSWGLTVGGGRDGRPDLKSRLSRRLATLLEPRAVAAADAITAVSAATYEEIFERHPELADKSCAAIPLGGEERDFEVVRHDPAPNPHFDPDDGLFHLCYVGTLLPLGFETLRAVLGAVARLAERRPALAERLRLHFFGTSNQTDPAAPQRALPVARELGVAHLVTEVAPRIDYLEALTVLTSASAILLMGSSESHYTASKLYPALLARRPLLAVYHRESSVSELLADAARPPSGHLVTYGDERRAGDRVDDIERRLEELVEGGGYRPEDFDLTTLDRFSARTLAGELAAVLDTVEAGR